MELADGARSFLATGQAYDAFMGRYSHALAGPFADTLTLANGYSVVDVGCGPGALTGMLVQRLGADAVSAFDPSPPFVQECAARNPGVDVRLGRAEAIPFEEDSFDAALAQLVFHFITDPAQALEELRRVVRPGGTVAACVWDFAEGMQMLRAFWDAAMRVDPDAPDEARTMRFGRAGELAALFRAAGYTDIEEATVEVSSTYRDFDELWSSCLAGIGTAGAFAASLPPARQAVLRDALALRLGSPTGSFPLTAVARCASGRPPAVSGRPRR